MRFNDAVNDAFGRALDLSIGDRVECYHADRPTAVLWCATVTARCKVARKFTVIKDDGTRRHFSARGWHVDPYGLASSLRIRRAG